MDFEKIFKSRVDFGGFAVLLDFDNVNSVKLEERFPPFSAKNTDSVEFGFISEVVGFGLNNSRHSVSLLLIFKLESIILFMVNNLEKVFEIFHVFKFPYMENIDSDRFLHTVFRD